MITVHFIINILLIISAAWVVGWLFERIGLPPVMGELLAGLLLGPPVFGLIGPSPQIELLADLGIFFVMFYTGVEMNPRALLEHIWPSLSVAMGGFILPFGLGYVTARFFGGTVYQSLFVGMGISITAIAVQSVILHSLKIHKTDLGHIIIGAAITDDILSLIGLSVLFGIVNTGSVELDSIAIVGLKVVGFFAATILIGQFVMPPITKKLHDREGKAFTFAMITALIMAYLAELAGLHLIIGAFLAGQFVRKEVMDEGVYQSIKDRFFGISYGFLVPIFFASLSFHLELQWSVHFLALSAVIIVAAVTGKVLGAGAGLYPFRRNWGESAVVGFGMNGRGAVELVVASVVIKLSDEMLASGRLSEPLLTDEQFSALILMAFVTTLIAPLTLKWAVRKTCGTEDESEFCKRMD